ncbi:MAG: hypothetical protein ACE5D1_01045, partial [Fidelibacterota bacterium]
PDSTILHDAEYSPLVYQGSTWGNWSAGNLIIHQVEIETSPDETLKSAWIDPFEPDIMAVYQDDRNQNQFIIRRYDRSGSLKQSFPIQRNRDTGLPLIRPFPSGGTLCLSPESQTYRWISPTGESGAGSVFTGRRFDLEKKVLTGMNHQGDFYSLHMADRDVRNPNNVVLWRWKEEARPDSLLDLPLTIPYYFRIRDQIALAVGTRDTGRLGAQEFREIFLDLTIPEIISWRRLRGMPRDVVLTADHNFLVYNGGIEVESVSTSSPSLRFIPFESEVFIHTAFYKNQYLWILATSAPVVDQRGIRYPDFLLIRYRPSDGSLEKFILDLPPARRVSGSFSQEKNVFLVTHDSGLSQFTLPAIP